MGMDLTVNTVTATGHQHKTIPIYMAWFNATYSSKAAKCFQASDSVLLSCPMLNPGKVLRELGECTTELYCTRVASHALLGSETHQTP